MPYLLHIDCIILGMFCEKYSYEGLCTILSMLLSLPFPLVHCIPQHLVLKHLQPMFSCLLFFKYTHEFQFLFKVTT